MKTLSWTGVYPALTTAFQADGSLDLVGFAHNILAQIDAGVDGLIVGGSLGESSTITPDERLALLHTACTVAAGRIPVLLNIAEGSTRAAVELAQKAQEKGADGLMVLPPMMYRPTQQETVDFFADVAQSTALPILVYNNPVDYKIEITPDMFETLLQHSTIQAVKDSTRDVTNTTRLISRFGDRLKVLCGVDTLALESMVMGAHGWVAGLVCAFPKETVAIYRLVKAGRIAEAVAIHRWFLPILELDINPQLVQNIKLAESLTGLGNEHVRAPRKPLSGDERERVMRVLHEGLASRPALPTF